MSCCVGLHCVVISGAYCVGFVLDRIVSCRVDLASIELCCNELCEDVLRCGSLGSK